VSKRRVVVTGLGIVSPVGSTVESAWEAILRGESGIGPVTRFDVSAFPVRFGGQVRGFDVGQYIGVKEARRMDEFMHYGVAAGVQAVTDSGIDFSKSDAGRCGAVCGAGNTCVCAGNDCAAHTAGCFAGHCGCGASDNVCPPGQYCTNKVCDKLPSAMPCMTAADCASNNCQYPGWTCQ